MREKKYRTFLILSALTVTLHLFSSCKQEQQLSPEEKEIYEVVNFFVWLNGFSERDTLLLDNLTNIDVTFQQNADLDPYREFPESERDYMMAQVKDTKPFILDSKWLNHPHRLISSDSIHNYLKKAAKNKDSISPDGNFTMVKPRGYITITKPIFTRDRKKAIICFNYENEYNSEEGSIKIIEKHENGWAVKEEISYWIGINEPE